jgi:hypothetical protein
MKMKMKVDKTSTPIKINLLTKKNYHESHENQTTLKKNEKNDDILISESGLFFF